MAAFVVFTDLDGTLLDAATYSFQPAQQALRELRSRGIPLIIVSSKTRAEIHAVRRAMDSRDPFIVENGGSLYVPTGYFHFALDGAVEHDGYQTIEFGLPYALLRKALREINSAVGGGVRGFGDMSLDEVVALTGLDRDNARLAAEREYDEPFVIDGRPELVDEVRRLADARGLKCTTGGRFHHLLGRSDKGKACRYLIECFRREMSAQTSPPITVALGDSSNDLPMLAAVDRPILLRRPNGQYEDAVDLPNLRRAPGGGPAGWNDAIMCLLEG